MQRTAIIQRRPAITVDLVSAYLPRNYSVTDHTDATITVSGEDYAGWTLDGYVIPRLASGMIFAREVGAS